jgi:hypothetical protein
MNNALIADTILRQIKALEPTALICWGVRQLVIVDRGLSFKSSGLCRWKGHVTIKLNHNDFYDITFKKIRAGKVILVKEVTDVFCGDLVSIIDAQVG